MNNAQVINFLKEKIPHLLAIYIFGSQAQGNARADSDLDLAVLVEGYADPISLWETAQQLADQIKCDIDLIDLRAASTVLQFQIISTGQRLWKKDTQAAIYESFILSEKTALDDLRAQLIADIKREGSVYGR